MLALINFFFELCLLRRAPQDLPASDTLFRLTLAADLAVGVLVGVTSGLSLVVGLLQSVAEISLTLSLLYLALSLVGHPGRFSQSATALLGVGTLIGVLALAPLALSAFGEGTDAEAFGTLLLLGLVAWSIAATGHILRHSFGIGLGAGIGIAVAYELFVISVMTALFVGA